MTATTAKCTLGLASADSRFSRLWAAAQENDIIYGEGGNDRLKGQSGDDWLYGGIGDDILDGGSNHLWGGDGNDLLDTEAGVDELYGEAGDDRLSAGGGNDTLDGGADNDQLTGGAGDDLLVGGTGSDYLDGGADNDTLQGGDGVDTLLGGAGVDQLYAGSGSDSFVFKGTTVLGEANADVIWDWQDGVDKIVIENLGINSYADNMDENTNIASIWAYDASLGDVVVRGELSTGEDFTIRIKDVHGTISASMFSASDFLFA